MDARWAFAYVIVGLLLLALGGCSLSTAPTAVPSPTVAPMPAARRVEVRASEFSFLANVSGRDKIEPPTAPKGVFAEVLLRVRNVSDSTQLINHDDFRLVDEEGEAHEPAIDAMQAWARRYLHGLQELYLSEAGRYPTPFPYSLEPPPTPLPEEMFAMPEFWDKGYIMLFVDKPVPPGDEMFIRLIFDIEPIGFERRLKIRFRDDAPVQLKSAPPR